MISISIKNASLKEFLSEMELQSGIRFSYIDNDLDPQKDVTITATNESIESILNKILPRKGLESMRTGNTIAIKKINPQTRSLQKNITGNILDNQGVPIIGANVSEKGTANGTVTDLDGNFSLSVPDNSTLQISYIGYLSQEIAVKNQNHFQITLKENMQNLDEVVVVGYGTQKKVNLTGAVSSVRFDKELQNRPITNASQALSGKVPGLWVSQNSGKPGSDGAQLRIRGWGTLNASDPLIIIDGVEGSFGQVNPNDIESISVLKDAASAAIYGSKAANGVVLVTTRMGTTNEKTEINLSAYFGIQSLGMHYDLVNNSAENMTMVNQGLTNDGSTGIFPEDLIEAFRTGTDKYKYPNTAWEKAFYRNSLMQEYNLSIKGGTQKTTSYLSFNYLNQDGLVPGTSSYRYSIRANLDYQVNNWLKVGGRFSYMHREDKEPYDLDRIFYTIAGAAPFIAPYTRDGRYGSVEAINKSGTLLYDNRNPFINSGNGARKGPRDFITANAFAQINFTKDLDIQATWSTTGNWSITDRYNIPLFGYTDSGIETSVLNFNREGLEVSRRQETTMRNNLYATLNYNTTLGEVHTISAIAGSQMEDYSWKYVYARRANAPKTGLTQVNAGTDGTQGEGNMEGLRMFSYFGRINYGYKDKYLFEANLRADASSRFKEGNRWGYFPGFSAGWRVTEEHFMKSNDIFSNLKLRASWGQLGNQSVSGYWPYLTVIAQNNALSYSYGGTLSPGAAVTAFVDENITWETTSTTDIGVDLGFLDNRLTIEGSYFYKKTTDILVQLPIPKILGNITAPYENVGAMINKGIEFSANYDNRKNGEDEFGFNIGLNFTYIDNKVTKFRGGKSPDQLYLIREGYPYRVLYGYKATGLYQSDEEATTHMYANGYKPKAGDLKFEDVNNDGKLDHEDKQTLGNTIPKVTYGITANFRYKNFDLGLLLQGIGGANLYTQNEYTRFAYELLTIPTFWRDAWTPANTQTNIPALRFNSSWTNSENSFWVHKSDYIKLKNIQLGYMVPKSITAKLKLESIYLYANGQNFWTILLHKGYTGFDPERNTNMDGQVIYPTPRIISFGLNINF